MTLWNFVCPDCGGNNFEEVMDGVVLHFPMEAEIDEDDEKVIVRSINEPELHEGFTLRFQCHHCGWVIKNDNDNVINSYEDLEEWIKEQISII